ncbi:ABC-2 type transport system ATP-binding protein [Lentibacillus halodurans]|uniref:ABC-2 type transport system ATP-binding protein n=1 Tax=Lentibacillus halodurans TaxID=237679 RepID=A0A1I0ZCF1_9BACI|nr:ABC transporter ATP-binding protein [Lentibacillus halodurans]SFB21903.1 ABC-2 type transport system ATP-binding protein [Lentibacillus halodurans]
MKLEVEVNNVSLYYNGFAALKDCSFRMESGKIYGLLGRNGAGKTSLLTLLASFRKVTEGFIEIGGEDPFENAKIMQHVAFHYETDYKEEWENVKGMLKNVERYRPYFDRDYALYLADRFKLPLKKPINKLSKGMQSALEVTMGLAARAPITIFDETYLGMDAPAREIFYQELLEDQTNHPRTMILSTHLVSEMDYLFDDVIMIDQGLFVLHEDYETLVSKGASITGPAEEADKFVSGMTQLNEQHLGNTKAIMVYGELDDARRSEAQRRGLEVGPISLQDLFIHLTSEEV